MKVIAVALLVGGVYLAFYSNILLAFLALAAGVWFGVAALGMAADAADARPQGGAGNNWNVGGDGGGTTTRDDRARCGGGDSVSGDGGGSTSDGGGSTSDCGGGGGCGGGGE